MSFDFKRGLLSAAEKGELNKVDNYLKKVTVDVTDEQNQTALHCASANGHELIVRHLIKKGAALECKNWAGWTPIMFASYYGHLNVVALLVHNKAEINTCNQRHATPLTCAARCGHKGVIEYLLENGADYNLSKNEDKKPTVTPLMAAAQHGHSSIVSLLLQYGVEVDYQNPDTGYTALMFAALNGHLDIVELLVKNGGANVNLTNHLSQNAYQLSIIRQRTDIQEYLNEKTRKCVRISVSSKVSQLIDAAKGSKYDDVVQLLQKSDVDINAVDDNGATALIYGSICGQSAMVDLLLRNGANPDVQDKLHGWTALMQATLKRHVDIVKILLKYKADITIKNAKGLTVFELATIVGDPQITRLLCPRGNDIEEFSLDSESDEKGGMKNWMAKVGGKMGIKQKNIQTVSRVSIQSCDIFNGSSIGDDHIDLQEESDGLKKTSSVLSVLDANKSLNGSVKARITLVSPQVKLPDDVVAPILPPYSKFPTFDLPKMPIKGSKLSNSNGSNGEISPYNSSNESASFQQITDINEGKKLKRAKQNSNTSFKAHQEPDSPQSSMTSSGITSISQYHGQPIMPNPLFKNPNSGMPFSKPSLAAWGTPPTQKLNMNNKQIPSLNFDTAYVPSRISNSKAKKAPSLSDFQMESSVYSIRSNNSNQEGTQKEEDIGGFLQKLSLEKYRTAFEDEEVDMETLKEMNDKDLKSLDIDQTLDRQRILNAVNGGINFQPPLKNKGRSPNKHNNAFDVLPPASGMSSRKGSSVSSTPGRSRLSPILLTSPPSVVSR